MRIVAQRVSRASVSVDGEVVGAIAGGLCLLVGIEHGDTTEDVDAAVRKLSGLRVFADDEQRMNRSVLDVGGGVLIISQFTLLADMRKGRRPSFTNAAPPEVAEPLIAMMMERFATTGLEVAGGRFGARMQVDLVNDGPVTVICEVKDGQVRGLG